MLLLKSLYLVRMTEDTCPDQRWISGSVTVTNRVGYEGEYRMSDGFVCQRQVMLINFNCDLH